MILGMSLASLVTVGCDVGESMVKTPLLLKYSSHLESLRSGGDRWICCCDDWGERGCLIALWLR